MRIAVVDYRKGNLKSVERGLAAAGAEPFVTDDAASLARADAVVLPGVGAFADAAASMRARGQMDAIRDRIAAGAPFLGICLGMHLMFEEGAEGSPREDGERSADNAPGLGILPGVVTALPRRDEAGNAYKIPHVGWNSIELAGPAESLESHAKRVSPSGTCFAAPLEPNRSADCWGEQSCSGGWAPPSSPREFDCPLLAGIQPGRFFYFTHGYAAPDTPCTVATTTHSIAFPSIVAYRDAAFGVQFHPEKSSDAGAALLRNFVRIARGV